MMISMNFSTCENVSFKTKAEVLQISLASSLYSTRKLEPAQIKIDKQFKLGIT